MAIEEARKIRETVSQGPEATQGISQFFALRRFVRERAIVGTGETQVMSDLVAEQIVAGAGQMQRPIVIRGGRAIIARPAEKLTALL